MRKIFKRIAVFMATAIVSASILIACEGPVGPPGPAGPQGETGQEGPQGDPGVTNNSPPTLIEGKALPVVYLAMAGDGAVISREYNLDEYFEDEETVDLIYKVTANPSEIVTTSVEGSDLSVDAVKAGTTTVTVSVYDRVNNPVNWNISVVVVEVNYKPVIQLDPVAENIVRKVLESKFFVSHGARLFTVAFDIDAGFSGLFEDEVTFRAMAGEESDEDDIVKFSFVKGSVLNTWDVTLNPVEEGKQEVTIYAIDKFGAESSVISFSALVNTVPKLVNPMEDVIVLYKDDSSTSKESAVTITLSDHFNLDEVTPMGNAVAEPSYGDDSDTTCKITTSPSSVDVPVIGTRYMDGSTDRALDLSDIMASAVAYIEDTPSPDATTFVRSTEPISLMINSKNAGTGPDATGEFILTITCRDMETSVSDSTTIRVRP